jgi:hypothetical protein
VSFYSMNLAQPMLSWALSLGFLVAPVFSQSAYQNAIKDLKFRSIGPAIMGGRVDDVAVVESDPRIIYVAAAAGGILKTVNGGGPDGGLYRTVDGGAHWTKLTKGLPQGGDTGRCAVDISRKNPNIVYALVENAHGGIFRSEDKGLTWTKMSDTNPRPAYYSQVRVDPSNSEKLWVLGAPLYYSEDGGRTFRQDRWQKIHSDFHAFGSIQQTLTT